jgi:hypothetical protein
MNPLNTTASLNSAGVGDTLTGARFARTAADRGDAELIGNARNDIFQFTNRSIGGQDFVTDLTSDGVLNLDCTYHSAADINDMISSASVSGSSSTVTLSDSTEITFIDVAMLDPSSFTTT